MQAIRTPSVLLKNDETNSIAVWARKIWSDTSHFYIPGPVLPLKNQTWEMMNVVYTVKQIFLHVRCKVK